MGQTALKDSFSPDIFVKHPSYSLWWPQDSLCLLFPPLAALLFLRSLCWLQISLSVSGSPPVSCGPPLPCPPSSDILASEASPSWGPISSKGFSGSYPSLFCSHPLSREALSSTLATWWKGPEKPRSCPGPHRQPPSPQDSWLRNAQEHPFIHFSKPGLRYNLHTIQFNHFKCLFIKFNDFSVTLPSWATVTNNPVWNILITPISSFTTIYS